MRGAKTGQFWNTEPQRVMANNSAVYTEKPTAEQFLEEWLSLVKSQTGERGIFNRGSLAKQMPARRIEDPGRRASTPIGANPCGEILLQSKQFCNLSEVVCRKEDTEETLLAENPHRDHSRHLSINAHQLPLPLQRMEEELRRGTSPRRFAHRPVGLPRRAERDTSAQAPRPRRSK